MKILLTSMLLLFSNTIIADSYDDNLKELFELTKVRASYVGLNSIIINQMQAGFFQAADQNIDASLYTEDQKIQIGKILKDRLAKMVKNYENLVKKSIPYEKIEQEIYIPLYKEAYTESEVKELISFYKTSVGKKSVESSQKISQQAARDISEKYDSLIVDFMKKQISENIEIVQKEIARQLPLLK